MHNLAHFSGEISNVEARLAIFGINDETRKVLAATWPIIRDRMPGAVDSYFDSCKALPLAAAVLLPNKDIFRQFYLSHFEIIFQGWFDGRYAESYRQKQLIDIKTDFHDSRPHMGF